MSSISTAVADAFRLLRIDLYDHLDEVEYLAEKEHEWSKQDRDTARELIPDLVLVIRGLLGEHEAHPSGVCRICASAWPCPVVVTIHELVKDPAHRFVPLLNRARADLRA